MSAMADRLPRHVRFGPGSLEAVPGILADRGLDRVLLIATRSQRSAAEGLRGRLGASCVAHVTGVREHVPAQDVAAVTETANQSSVDSVVALGGGSAIGLAKAIAARRDVPLVAVPTTYSGSEMTSVFGITRDGVKQSNKHAQAQPVVVVADPLLTTSLPPLLTATSGFNSLAHAVEALYAPAHNDDASELAGAALESLCNALPLCVEQPEDVTARSEALVGAVLAGAAMASAGMAFQHRLAHLFGGAYGVSHAGVHTVLLPHTAALANDLYSQAMATARTRLGDPPGAALFALATRIGAPTRLDDLGLNNDAVAAVACAVAAQPPPALSDEGVSVIEAMLERALVGLPPAPLSDLAAGRTPKAHKERQ